MKRLGLEPLIDPTASVERCRLGRYTEVGARTSLIETELGDYSYVVGAVVAAGAVVTTDVAAYSIVAGVPARVKKARFPTDVAQRIEALGWWDWDHEQLRAALHDFRTRSPEQFLQNFGG